MTIYGHYLNIYKTPLNSTVEAVFFVICKAIIFNQHPAFSAFNQHFALGNILFGLFGASRGPFFQIFRASGLPDGSFSPKTTRRGIPKHCFSEFQPFGMPRSSTFPVFLLVACERNAVFRIFCISLTSDRPFSPFFARRSRATNDFQHFQSFPRGGKSVLAVISFSIMRESRFMMIFCFPP